LKADIYVRLYQLHKAVDIIDTWGMRL